MRQHTEVALGLSGAAVISVAASFVDDPEIAWESAQELLKVALGADAALLGIVLAGLAVATSIARPEFVRWLRERALYDRLTRPFWITSVLWAVNLFLHATTFIGTYIWNVAELVFIGVVMLNAFMFSYALAGTLGLVLLIFDLTNRQAEFDRTLDNGPSSHI